VDGLVRRYRQSEINKGGKEEKKGEREDENQKGRYEGR
jgi:hypothetical protein